MNSQDWYTKPSRLYGFEHYQFDFDIGRIPPFMKSLPNNSWTWLTIFLSDYLGMYSWGWDLNILAEFVNRTSPAIDDQKSYKAESYRFMRWFRSLKPEQKKAWKVIALSAEKYSKRENKMMDYAVVFLCRLTTVILSNHHQALASLQQMRAPLVIIRSFENWLLSENYSIVRRDHQLENKVPVTSILKSESILED